jgi:hypothetical protein
MGVTCAIDCHCQEKRLTMENRINLSVAVNSYVQHFFVAQQNLDKIVKEERLLKKIRKSKLRKTVDDQ